MPVPFVAAAYTAAKSEVVQGAVGKVSEGVQGLFGDTAKDKQRKARAAALTAAALSGDPVALRQLAFDAFEPANGEPGDNRPIDRGRRSPPDSRDLARKGLQQYAAKFGGLPPTLAKYATAMAVPVREGPPPLLQQILTPAINTITDTAIDRAAERTQSTVQRYMPLIVGGVVVVALVLYMSTRRK